MLIIMFLSNNPSFWGLRDKELSSKAANILSGVLTATIEKGSRGAKYYARHVCCATGTLSKYPNLKMANEGQAPAYA